MTTREALNKSPAASMVRTDPTSRSATGCAMASLPFPRNLPVVQRVRDPAAGTIPTRATPSVALREVHDDQNSNRSCGPAGSIRRLMHAIAGAPVGRQNSSCYQHAGPGVSLCWSRHRPELQWCSSSGGARARPTPSPSTDDRGPRTPTPGGPSGRGGPCTSTDGPGGAASLPFAVEHERQAWHEVRPEKSGESSFRCSGSNAFVLGRVKGCVNWGRGLADLQGVGSVFDQYLDGLMRRIRSTPRQ